MFESIWHFCNGVTSLLAEDVDLTNEHCWRELKGELAEKCLGSDLSLDVKIRRKTMESFAFVRGSHSKEMQIWLLLPASENETRRAVFSSTSSIIFRLLLLFYHDHWRLFVFL